MLKVRHPEKMLKVRCPAKVTLKASLGNQWTLKLRQNRSMWKCQLIKLMWEQHTPKVNVKQRKAVLYASRGKRCNFVNSHMHLDKLQAIRRMQHLDMIMKDRPMPSMPVELQLLPRIEQKTFKQKGKECGDSRSFSRYRN